MTCHATLECKRILEPVLTDRPGLGDVWPNVAFFIERQQGLVDLIPDLHRQSAGGAMRIEAVYVVIAGPYQRTAVGG